MFRFQLNFEYIYVLLSYIILPHIFLSELNDIREILKKKPLSYMTQSRYIVSVMKKLSFSTHGWFEDPLLIDTGQSDLLELAIGGA